VILGENKMNLLTLKEYAIKNKISIFNVMKMVKSQKLKSIIKEENGREVIYIISNDADKSQISISVNNNETKNNEVGLENEILELKDEVSKLRKELNRLKVIVFKMAKEDAKTLKI
jgi:uncharacterized protein YceH (UPF0502 family)